MNADVMNRCNLLFEELVPLEGKAECLAGEIIRAVSRIGYRFFNDGDHLGLGYGKETCNAAGRFLSEHTTEAIASTISALWGLADAADYEKLLDLLALLVVDFVETHPELRSQPTPNMFDYYDEIEDRDIDDEDYVF